MHNHILFKFIAILLCACCLLAAVGAGVGIAVLESCGLYDGTPQELMQDTKDSRLWSLAHDIAYHYAATELGGCPEALADRRDYYSTIRYFPDSSKWFYTVTDENGTVVDGTYTNQVYDQGYSTHLTAYYPTVLSRLIYRHGVLIDGSLDPSTPAETFDQGETVPQTTAPQTFDPFISTDAGYEHTESTGYSDGEYSYDYLLGYKHSPMLLVTLYLQEDAYTGDPAENILEQVWHYRYQLPMVLGGALLLFAALLVYLCCAAGRAPKREEVKPGGLNLLPLDLYAAIVAVAGVLALLFIVEILPYNLLDIQLCLIGLIVGGIGLVLCLLVVGFLFACAAQFKMGGLYWLRHSLTGMVLVLGWRILRWGWRLLKRMALWLKTKLPPLIKLFFQKLEALIRWLWQSVKTLILFLLNGVKKAALWLWGLLSRFCALLPLTWQWLLTAFLMAFLLFVGIRSHNAVTLLLSLAICLGILLYGTQAFGTLLESVKRMSKGDLGSKVDDRLMVGSFKDFSDHLNDLAGVATMAAQQQMKSERMKAELVTNVSHDIKTPLTSIINYVDLLQKAQTKEETEEYLEVLSRQSQRMKKLIDDLMEMSKASTGNLPVEITKVDAVEAVNQALGEFADKLSAAQLAPVFQPPEKPVLIRADGRLAWRVLSNLLSNAVKYALPGTRLYVDLVEVDAQVLISLKNISREPLNVSSEELMERFVRGDASRNTEGSGLGLNIAKSLMELQHGQLQLLIDGDLFKATLIFPKA
ncbi:MAG: HAMP domain-containing histidine kinase [Oscillospiraceae bacterium]|nr:HAMP domain-containing histidine kinase [Oscillospiraceae bacterium]